jgi:hypothetical protein
MIEKFIPPKIKDKFKPYSLVEYKGQTKEIISYPFYTDYRDKKNNTIHIMIREERHPCTMIGVDIKEIKIKGEDNGI